MSVPAYLKDYADLHQSDPRAAGLQWFRDAKFGLFMHYGLYSLLGGVWKGQTQQHKGAEWIRLAMDIPLGEYAKLQDRFTAENFDADAICQLAAEAGMKYVNLTTQHHDGFCLWDTATTDFHSAASPAGRDLVAELVTACDAHGLGCFLYYSHGRDWWHPDSPDNGSPSCRPANPQDREHFHWGDEIDLDRYLDLVSRQVAELCAYRPVAGIWLDGIGEFLAMDDAPRVSRAQELYDQIHASQPQILVSYKQGLTHTEDFYAPERQIREGTVPADGRPYEICTTLQPRSWGYRAADDGLHHDADWVMDQLAEAAGIPANLLLNTGPLPDGSIPEEDVETLRQVGRRMGA